jgi:hypothetical protein
MYTKAGEQLHIKGHWDTTLVVPRDRSSVVLDVCRIESRKVLHVYARCLREMTSPFSMESIMTVLH